MNNSPHPLSRSCISASLCMILLMVGAPSNATGEELSMEEAVERALQNNQQLEAARVSTKIAAQVVRREEGQFVPLLQVEAGIRDGSSAQLDARGNPVFVSSQAISTSSSVSYQTFWGMRLNTGLDVARELRDTAFFGNLGEIWNTNLSFGVTQPLLRGFGPSIGQASIRDAKLSSTLAEVELTREQRNLVQNTKRAWWQLWASSSQLEISQMSLDVAKEALAQRQKRVDVGLDPAAGMIALKTEIATGEESLVAAQTTYETRRIELARLLNLPPSTQITTSSSPPTLEPLPKDPLAIATQNSLELQRLRLETQRAAIAQELAKDRAQLNLEAIATLSASGIGRDAGESFAQLGEFDAVVGYVGLKLDWPLSRDNLFAEVERTELVQSQLGASFQATSLNLEAQLATQLNELRLAKKRLKLAKTTAELAAQNSQEVRARFNVGSANALEVVQVLNQERQALLRVTQSQVDLALARIAIDLLLLP